jgi:hypothetical protein
MVYEHASVTRGPIPIPSILLTPLVYAVFGFFSLSFVGMRFHVGIVEAGLEIVHAFGD